MHKRIVLSVILLGATGARAEDDEARWKPLPGRDVVKPMAPDWCAGAEMDRWQHAETGLHETRNNVENGGWDEKALRNVARIACVAADDPEARALVAKWRQDYVNMIGTSEKEDRAAQKLRASKDYESLQKAWCESITVSDEASPEERSMAEALAVGTGCEWQRHGGLPLSITLDGTNPDLGWWIDRRAEVDSEITRAIHVLRCLRYLEKPEQDWPDPKSVTVQAAYVACGVDARRLDRGRLDKELGDSKFNEYARVHAREVWTLAKTVSDRLTAAFKQMADKDEAYKKIFFDGPEKGWADWQAAYAANKEAVDAAFDYEKKFYGPSRKALQGCGDKLRKGFASYIQSKKPQTLDEAKKAALDMIGSPLMEALALCEAVEGRLQIAETYVKLLEGNGEGLPADRRGPRYAAYAAALTHLSDILADRERFPVKQFYLRVDPPAERMRHGAKKYYTDKVLWAEDPKGTIASATKKGDAIEVTFKPVTTYIMNRVCKPNNRILRIDSNGRIIYDSDCAIGSPPRLPVTTKNGPILVPERVGAGLKAGVTGVFAVNVKESIMDGKKPSDGLPKEIWDATGKKLLNWYGIPLQ